MNNQEVFNKVSNHLLTQGQRSEAYNSIVDGISCAYRGTGELMCSIGCLIADEFYNPIIEGTGVECRTVKQALEQSLGCELSNTDLAFLGILQSIHDAVEPKRWHQELEWFAIGHDLEFQNETS